MLDVAVLQTSNSIIVSIDMVHIDGSMKTQRPDPSDIQYPFEAFLFSGMDVEHEQESEGVYLERFQWRPWQEAPELDIKLLGDMDALKLAETHETVNKRGGDDEHNLYDQLGEFLGGLEHLRKRKGVKTNGDGDDDVEENETGTMEP